MWYDLDMILLGMFIMGVVVLGFGNDNPEN